MFLGGGRNTLDSRWGSGWMAGPGSEALRKTEDGFEPRCLHPQNRAFAVGVIREPAEWSDRPCPLKKDL